MSHGQHGQLWKFTSFSIQKVARPSGTNLQRAVIRVNSSKFHLLSFFSIKLKHNGAIRHELSVGGARLQANSYSLALLQSSFADNFVDWTWNAQMRVGDNSSI